MTWNNSASTVNADSLGDGGMYVCAGVSLHIEVAWVRRSAHFFTYPADCTIKTTPIRSPKVKGRPS